MLSLFDIDFPPQYVMIAAEIADKSWNLFKMTIDFAKVFIGTIKKEKKVPEVNIINSPNAQACVICHFGSGPVQVGKDIYDAFNSNAQNISSIAEVISPAVIDTLEIEKVDKDHKKIDGVRFDSLNREDFTIEERKIPIDDAMTFECKVYSLNTRTRKGRLDIIGNEDERDGAEQPGIGFEIADGAIEDYIAALKLDSVSITARYELLVSTLGKSKITYLFPTAIALP